MDVYNSIHEMVGNTPILKLNNLGIKEGVNLYAKLELLNPEPLRGGKLVRMLPKKAEDLKRAAPLLKQQPETQA